MKENNNNHERRGGRGFGRRHRHRPEVEVVQKLQIASLPCVICGQLIQEMSSAIGFGPEAGPAHFDCVLKNLESKETLQPDERISYLGTGVFGVIKPVTGTEGVNFQILRKIQVESKDVYPEWRKEIKNRVKKISGALPTKDAGPIES